LKKAASKGETCNVDVGAGESLNAAATEDVKGGDLSEEHLYPNGPGRKKAP